MLDLFRESARPLRRRSGLASLLLSCLMTAGLLLVSLPALAQITPAELNQMKALYQRPKSVPFPKANPYSAAKLALGQQLFFDQRLSGPGNMSCATCHNPTLAWGDGQPTGTGSAGNRLGRRTPTILNLAWAEMLMWDGRADTLEEQALGPIENPNEMNMPLPRLVSTLRDIPAYRTAFAKAFPGEQISTVTIGKAIATFERTAVSAMAPFDRWIAGEESAIDPAAKRGFVTFNAKARCSSCHSGWRFTDDSFHDIGLPGDDQGRSKIVPEIELLRYAFKTPTLRNATERAPFMHNGSKATLLDVIAHYNSEFERRPSLSADIKRLNLSAKDFEELIAFIETLTSRDPVITAPANPFEESRK